ncbi:MAG: hypothetical protein CW716_05455 [Candidatus Bathyarchaeum sp.]|nr:MAG: hypothetical protein CW716_05455 [Candidatus Bathyarchaeum sp.]
MGCVSTKKLEFEPADVLHKNWLDYSSKHDTNKEIEPLIPLLNDPKAYTRTHEQILDALYNATLVVLESTPLLDYTQKTRAEYFSYNMCQCDECLKTCGAHINKKGQIRVSKKFFEQTIEQQPPAGLLEIMYSIFHQILHGIFPELDEETVVEKTEKVWETGMAELAKEKLNNN